MVHSAEPERRSRQRNVRRGEVRGKNAAARRVVDGEAGRRGSRRGERQQQRAEDRHPEVRELHERQCNAWRRTLPGVCFSSIRPFKAVFCPSVAIYYFA